MNALGVVAGLFVLLGPARGWAAEPLENPAGVARAANAGGDHGFLTSHAETLPAGAFSLNFYEIFVFGFSAGLTDRLSLSLTMTPPVASPPEWVALHAKYVVHRSDRTVVALRLTNLDLSSWDDDGYRGGLYTLGPGVAVDRFVGDAGRFSVHAGLSVHTGKLVGSASDHTGWAGLVAFEAGVTLRTTDWLDVMVEGQGAVTSTEGGAIRLAPYGLVTYGVRFFDGFAAGDVALTRPVGDVDLGWLALGIPYLGLSIRF
jgi:hypothetical protein